MFWLTELIALAMIVNAVVQDLRRGRIDNRLTYGGLLLGLLLGFLPWGLSWRASALGMALSGALYFLFWLSNGIGAGDVKLMAALGALLGFPRIWDLVVCSAISGGVLALLFLVWKKFPSVPDEEGEAVPSPTLPRRKQKMPYALAIAAGYLLTHIIPLIPMHP